MLIVMRFGKFVKNKDALQFIITVVLLVLVFNLEFNVIEGLFGLSSEGETQEQFETLYDKAREINKYFLIVNPSVDILSNPFSLQSIISFIELVAYNFVGFIFFILIGKVTYLKDVLYNITSYTKNKHKKVKLEKNSGNKNRSIAKSYVIKEFKILLKEPVFFLQCVFPVLIVMITCIILALVFSPIITEVMNLSLIHIYNIILWT